MVLDIAVHKNICIKILKDIFSDPSTRHYLGFKGDTAALLFYGLTRFSVDLDFDLLEEEQEEDIFDQLIPILEKYGTIKDAKNKRYTILFQVAYYGKLDRAENIKVEISKRKFGSHYAVKEYLGIPMKVIVPEDMVSVKLMAMYNLLGKANRDIYDVWYFLENNFPVNKKIIEEVTRTPYKEFLEKCINALSTLSNQRILDGLGLLLTPHRKTWAKAHLLQDTIFLLKLAHSNE
jgi:predicted nucleotidyltransferase component of viral defense system